MRTRTEIAEITHALLRIAAGLMFLMHGGQKHFGWFGGVPGTPDGTVGLGSLVGVAGALELVGGAALILGLFTRPIAFLLAGEMAVAYFMAHLPRGFWPLQNNGEPAALFAFIWLFFAGNGAGKYSLDAILRRPEERALAERPAEAATHPRRVA
ncbi:MAG TPA: DoxX family protein [Longimicrobiales bacterium]|nr:DoxX family protein [Longimicrobiales bacterium]